MTQGTSFSICIFSPLSPSLPLFLSLSYGLKEMCVLRKHKSCLLVRVWSGDRNHINYFEKGIFFQFC